MHTHVHIYTLNKYISLYLCVCTYEYVCGHPRNWGARRGHWIPWRHCYMVVSLPRWGWNSSPLDKDQAHLTTETSLQPPEECSDTFYELNFSSCFAAKKTMDTYMKSQLYKKVYTQSLYVNYLRTYFWAEKWKNGHRHQSTSHLNWSICCNVS